MGFRGVILFLLSLLLAISLALTIVGFQGFTLLQANTYLPSLEQHGFYNVIASNLGQGEVVVALNDTIKQFMERSINEVFDYINERTDTLNLTVDLSKVDVRSILTAKIGSLPVCADNADWSTIGTICRPAGLSAEEAYDKANREGKIPSIPKSIDLTSYINEGGKLDSLREKAHIYRVLVYSALIVSIVLMILILLVGYNTHSRGLRNIGVPIILAGVGTFSGAYLGIGIAAGTIPPTPPGLNFNPADVLFDILDIIKSRLIITGIALIIIGLIVFVCSFVFARKDDKKEEKDGK